MNLSKKAKEYISKLNKDLNWSTMFDETEKFLLKNNIKPTVEILNFQANYSGLELTIRNQPNQTFEAFLFSKKQVKNIEHLEIDKIDNKIFFECGSHKTAQFNFFLTDKGEICTIGEEDLNILYSSFEKYIEGYAILNEIFDWARNPYYFEISNYDMLLEQLEKDFKQIDECSDHYHSWWTNNELIVEKGVWLDRPEYYLHVFGKSETACNKFVTKLKQEKILK